MPHEWVSTLTVMALSVLVLSSVTLTTQQYVFNLEDALAEDKLQDLTDEIATKVISLYNFGHKSDADPSDSNPIIDVANTRLTLLERTIGNSFYRVVLNNSTGTVEAYLSNDPSVRASTSLQGIHKHVDLSGDAWSGNNTYIWYQKRLNQKDLISINNGVFEFFQLALISSLDDMFIQNLGLPNPTRYAGVSMNITNVGTNDVDVYWIELRDSDGNSNYYNLDSGDPPSVWWTINAGETEEFNLYFGPWSTPPTGYLEEHPGSDPTFPNYLDEYDELTIIFYFDQVTLANLASADSQEFTVTLPEVP
ncbi:hypothetical protein [Candidatus Borrarchaeum sp.]|uniref:hypothetical protein n=1 Tax=Candidatus Borrarchaeum sp. TaxID=2846742 RepID=UPI0025794C90|nr:hypothetical protein [Candidatus Borrarchaeum sp.]